MLPTEEVYGYCKSCDSLVLSREVFLCKKCQRRGSFQRSSSTPLDHFTQAVNPVDLEGACSHCNKEGLEVQYKANGQWLCDHNIDFAMSFTLSSVMAHDSLSQVVKNVVFFQALVFV